MTEPTQEQLTARAEADVARFEEALPTSHEIGTTGELAALAATLPADTPLSVEQHLRADQALRPDPVEVAVAHIAGARVRLAPDRPDSPSRTLPGLGPTTVRVDRSQDAGTEFDRGDMEPLDLLARAELRLMTDGNVEDGITDVADVFVMLARVLEKGAGFIDRDRLEHDGELPIVEGTLVRLKVEHLSKEREAPPVWLWSSKTGATPADVDLW
nr:hypothetical protein [Streptomyces noursei]